MEGQNLSAIAPSFLPFGGALGSARQAWVLIAAVILLPTGDLGHPDDNDSLCVGACRAHDLRLAATVCNAVHSLYGHQATEEVLPAVFLRSLGLLAYLSAAGVLTSLSLTCLVGVIAGEHGAALECTLCDCFTLLS